MEVRQVVQSLCRSSAAATRPSLASIRPAPSTALLLQCQYHRFSTNAKQQQQEAAAAPAATPQQQSHRPTANTPNPSSLLFNRSLETQAGPKQPPRPQMLSQYKFRSNPKSKKHAFVPPAGHLARSGTPLTGRGPTAGGGSSLLDVVRLPLGLQMEQDMNKATGTLTNWNDEFTAGLAGPPEPEMRLRPSTGRTVNLKGNIDVARGFSILNKLVKRNRLKVDEREQRFHERPALKRKRQKRELWQVRFKAGFRGAIERVMELKAQGW